MSTEAALLRTIRDTPDDDTARLVYADFVEEEGDAARGEFIRVQVALANAPAGDPSRGALEEREHALLAENEDRWLCVPPDSDGLVEWRFERGFVNELSATTSFMLNEGADVFAAHPVRSWRVQCSQQDMDHDLREAGQRPWFRRLESVSLARWFQAVGEIERFLTRSDFERLRELDLTDRPGLEELPGILERSPLRAQLKILRLGGRYPGGAGRLDAWDLTRALAPARLAELHAPGCLLTAPDVRELLINDCCSELRTLNVRDNQLEPDGWDAFRGVRCRLRELDLSGTPLGAIALDDVLRQESMAELRSLSMNRCGSAVANIRALVASRFWTQAEELRMRAGTIPENSLEPILASAGPPGLRTLDVGQNFFRDAGVAGLCNAKWVGSLTWLSLEQNYLTDEALRTIATCGRLPHLEWLSLANNNRWQDGADPEDRITDAGVKALAGSSTLPNLRHLDLSGTEIGAEAIDALLNDDRCRLNSLGLAGCYCSPDMIRVMALSPGLARLRRLDLRSNSDYLRGDALLRLSESEYLSSRCVVDVRDCHPDSAAIDALRARLGRHLIDGDTTAGGVGDYGDLDL